MFELSVIRKYLVPRKKQLSVTLIATMSVSVIALVVWLLLVFLSVTDGIEKNWLDKLTSLNAPIKITPSRAYYSSYYYLADTISSASNFETKSIGQKAQSERSDPHDPAVDPEIPSYWQPADKNPDGTLKDPVKSAFAILDSMPELTCQEFALSGAMLRLELIRPESTSITSKGGSSHSFITQVSYLASFADKSPYVQSLLVEPSVQDFNHLCFLANQSPDFSHQIQPIVKNLQIEEVRPSRAPWRFSSSLLQENEPFRVNASVKGGILAHLMVSDEGKATLVRKGSTLLLDGQQISDATPIFTDTAPTLKARLLNDSLQGVKGLKDLSFAVEGSLQGRKLAGKIAWDGIEIAKASNTAGNKLISPSQEKGVLLAKSLYDSGVRIGDRGYLSYQAATAASLQEQRIPVFVAGFYDPGIMSIGGKCILVPLSVAEQVAASSSTQHFDKTASSGIQVWFKDVKNARHVQKKLQEAFEKAGIAPYWTISTYHDYDFAKDLLQQFQSDRILFTLIGIIILMVACSNIISLLVILVSDKKKEIGILMAMGARPSSIAAIFGGAGIAMGLLSSLLGTGLALLTLLHLDRLVFFLSALQGHDAFNAAFYGNSLPNELSYDALIFVLIATPILSLLAGLVPAIKACRVRPSDILRSP